MSANANLTSPNTFNGHSAAVIAREMLGLAVDALLTGTAAALVAGGLVVLLACNAA